VREWVEAVKAARALSEGDPERFAAVDRADRLFEGLSEADMAEALGDLGGLLADLGEY
jgi:hypothetical protein